MGADAAVVTAQPSTQGVSRAGLGRAVRRIVAGLALGILLYAGLVAAGAIRSPFAPAAGGELALARSDRHGLRVLFVGNSFTFENAMPELVEQLSRAGEGGQPLLVVQYTAGGWTLADFSRDDGLTNLLKKAPWNVVVLQEQSQLPSFSADQRSRELDPFATDLQRKITSAGARTMLFMTWGYKYGDRQNLPADTFAAMQARLEVGYSELAARLPGDLAPVGRAWAEALRRDPTLDLWASDGKHPNRAGSYLAACVFYATLSHRDPIGNAFTAGLHQPEARFLQTVASDVVAGRR
jgi:hypothetical protein